MTRLRSKFTRRQWKDCCGKGCKKCAIAQTYIDEYGHAKGLDKLNADRAAVKKAGKKGAAKKGAAKAGKAKKKVKA